MDDKLGLEQKGEKMCYGESPHALKEVVGGWGLGGLYTNGRDWIWAVCGFFSVFVKSHFYLLAVEARMLG